MGSYELNKKAIIKYQKENPNYRIYKRNYEKEYRNKNRINWNFKSWKKMRNKRGLRVTPQMEIMYYLERLI